MLYITNLYLLMKRMLVQKRWCAAKKRGKLKNFKNGILKNH